MMQDHTSIRAQPPKPCAVTHLATVPLLIQTIWYYSTQSALDVTEPGFSHHSTSLVYTHGMQKRQDI